MKGITDFNGVIDYIEAHLTDGIRVEDLARLTLTSVYEFRRIFSFVAGISVSEYIRRRRLSVAAEDLRSGTESVTEVSLKYGYDTPSSFSRAFKEFHGVSPTDLSKGAAARHFTRISFDLQVRGGREMRCEIRDEEAFTLRGHTGRSDLRDTECCERVWAEFYESPAGQDIPGDGKIYAAYRNGADWVDCTIGFRTEGSGDLQIPACRWACFSLNRTDDAYVNEFYKTVLYDWTASAGYCRKEGVPNLEVYPADMETDGFEWEIRIPIERN